MTELAFHCIQPSDRRIVVGRFPGTIREMLCDSETPTNNLVTAIFYETEWSLYVLWQAMRRVYRPGAPLPVELYFPVYAGTMRSTCSISSARR